MQLFFHLATFIILLTVFVSNGVFDIYKSFIVFLIIFAFSLLYFFKSENYKIRITLLNVLFSIFTILGIIFIFSTYNFNNSLSYSLFCLQCLFLFIFLQQISSENLVRQVLKSLVVLTTIFGIFSFTIYIETGLLAGYRLSGFVGPAGFYGLFLIAPLIISFYLLYNENRFWPRCLWYFTTVIIFTSLFLTFAYLAWFVLIIILLCGLFVFRKRIININKKSLFKSILLVLTLSFVLFCGIWYMARQSTMNQVREQNYQSVQHDKSDYRAVLIWFILMSLFYGQYLKKKITSPMDTYIPGWSLYVLLIFSIVCLIISIQLLRADRAILKGDKYLQNKNYDIALSNYFQSLTYNSYNDVAWYKIWKVYYAMNRFELAKNSINRAIALERRNGVYWASLALSNKALDEIAEYESNMENAKRYLSP